MVELRNAHKLAALAVLLALCVAGYFIISGLSGQRQAQPTSGNDTTTRSPPDASAKMNGSATAAANVDQSVAPDSGVSEPASQPTEVTQMSHQEPAGGTQTSAAIATVTTSSDKIQAQEQSVAPEPVRHIESSGAPLGQQPQTSASDFVTLNNVTTTVPSTQTTVPFEQQTPPNLTDRTQTELDRWQEFKTQYKKTYASPDEEIRRQGIFVGNLRFIRAFNEHSQALFKLDVNQFADFMRDEINELFVGPLTNWNQTIGQSPSPAPMRILADDSQAGADSRTIDWRNLTGSEPLDQGTCKESSVFAIVASLESALNAASTSANANPDQPTGARIKLSEQQVLDCLAYSQPLAGGPPVCQGALSMVHVFEFLQHQGIKFASAHEYAHFKQLQTQGLAPPGTCLLPPGVPDKPKLGAYVQVHRDNMLEALLNSSPLVVAIDASQPTFHFYKSGLYHEMQCSAEAYSLHALLVGYSPATNGDSVQASYTIRASFGPNWGESGHMRLLKDESRNKCLPQNLAIYPNLDFS